jgi:predicted DNA-binding protein (UPF0251 family)
MALGVSEVESRMAHITLGHNIVYWATVEEQGRNTRRNVLTLELAKQLRIDAKNMTYDVLANKYNVSKGTIWNVIAYKIWRD